MQKNFLLIASAFGALTVAIGAFGAHGLKNILEANQRIENFETAVRYQFYHTVALFLVVFLMDKFEDRWLAYAGFSFIGGIFIFSGSLYALSLTNVTKWGAITPLGGLLFIIGWTVLFVSIYKNM